METGLVFRSPLYSSFMIKYLLAFSRIVTRSMLGMTARLANGWNKNNILNWKVLAGVFTFWVFFFNSVPIEKPDNRNLKASETRFLNLVSPQVMNHVTCNKWDMSRTLCACFCSRFWWIRIWLWIRSSPLCTFLFPKKSQMTKFYYNLTISCGGLVLTK